MRLTKAAVGCQFFLLVSCSDAETSNSMPITTLATSSTSTGAESVASDDCSNGEKRACHVTLSNHNGVTSCFVGVQTCIEGMWSSCGEI